jgi:hypothetical protein
LVITNSVDSARIPAPPSSIERPYPTTQISDPCSQIHNGIPGLVSWLNAFFAFCVTD